MKKLSLTIFAIIILIFQVRTQSQGENYIYTTVPHEAVQTISDLDLLPQSQKTSSISYFDGLGRSKQEISQGLSPKGKDIVKPIVYDSNGNRLKDYLAFATNGSAGNLVSSVLGRQEVFYNSAHRVSHTQYAFSEVKLDNSPIRRVVEKSSPGTQWNINDGHTANSNVVINTADEIIHWSIGSYGQLVYNGNYSANRLVGYEVIDENGTISQVFSIASGLEVLSRRKLENEWIETYSVYNAKGQLRFIIQPQGIEHFRNAGLTVQQALTGDVFHRFVFIYKYDNKGRVIKKKIPGAHWIEYYYNDLNQVVLIQDGNQKLANDFSYKKYDVHGNIIMTGIFDADVYNYSIDRDIIESLIQSSSELWETPSGEYFATNQGYSNQAFPSGGLNMLTVNYYDDYDFNRDGADDYVFNMNDYLPVYSEALGDPTGTAPSIITNTPRKITRGHLTCTKSKILNGPKEGIWISTVSWFDDKGREIQTFNHNYINGYSRLDSFYDFLGEIVHSNLYHVGDPDNDGNIESANVKTRNVYDHAGRLLKTYSQFNDQIPVLMVENHYNEIGQLIESNYHSEVLGSYLQSVDFSYNPRGWLTHINNCDLENDDLFTDFEGVNYDHIQTELKTIKLNLDEVHNDGTLQVQLTIVADREVTVKEKESTNTKTVTKTDTRDQNVKTKEPDASGSDPVYESLLALSSQNIELDLNDIEIEAGMTTAQVYGVAEQKLEAELKKFNVTDTRTKDLLKSRVGEYLVQRMGNVYFNNDDNDLWGMCIEYNTTSENFSNDPLYNGNISEVHWKNGLDNVKRAYGYTYDDLSRFKSGTHKAYSPATNTWNLELGDYNEFGLEYDANGNIQTLKRNGFTNTTDQFQLMDDLVYSYKGNQLQAVQDNSLYENENHFDFTDGADLAEEYLYDANGNMIEDKNKGISSISYNHLNLPESVLFSSGEKIEFIYDANGIRRHKISMNAIDQINNSYYDGAFHYSGTQISFIQQSKGRVVPVENQGVTTYQYEYHYIDHQNNTRLSYSDLDHNGQIDPETEVLQLNDYYPFGLEHQGHSNWQQIGANHPYKFQGQEVHQDFGLNWNQFKWRNHQADIGRFFTVDPLSEDYTHNSVYAFSENKLLDHIELEGLEGVPTSKTAFVYYVGGDNFDFGGLLGHTGAGVYNPNYPDNTTLYGPFSGSDRNDQERVGQDGSSYLGNSEANTIKQYLDDGEIVQRTHYDLPKNVLDNFESIVEGVVRNQSEDGFWCTCQVSNALKEAFVAAGYTEEEADEFVGKIVYYTSPEELTLGEVYETGSTNVDKFYKKDGKYYHDQTTIYGKSEDGELINFTTTREITDFNLYFSTSALY